MLSLTIFVILITYGACTPIEVDGEGRISWDSMFLRERKAISTDSSQILTRRRRFLNLENVEEMRIKSYEHSPQEFLRLFGPAVVDLTDEYDIFRELYLDAFPEEPIPTYTFTDNKLAEMRNEFEWSKCRRPRMKMIDLYEELVIPPEIVISPPAVNLSRCGSNSGCCPKGQSCDSTGQNFKSKTIMVLYIDGNDISVKRYNVTEHEECQCRDSTPDTSCAYPTEVGHTSPFACDKKCTSFFRLDSDCQCNECKSSGEKHIRCKKLKRGARELSEEQAQCVAEGRCVTPTCNNGRHYSPSNRTCIYNQTVDLQP